MKLVAILALVSIGWLAAVAPVEARIAGRDTGVSTDVSAQKRAWTKVRVYPLYPRQPYHSLYPPAYDVRFPGPNARRECVARYVQEYRPSGTVIVPRMRCRWVRG